MLPYMIDHTSAAWVSLSHNRCLRPYKDAMKRTLIKIRYADTAISIWRFFRWSSSAGPIFPQDQLARSGYVDAGAT